jgi:iron complex transport system substrate-binding protein
MNHFFNQKYLGCWLILATALSYTGGVNANIETKSVKNVPRVVAAGGSITEILYALGAQDFLVGVDSSSLYPADAATIANVGYYRQLSVEGVMSVNPTLVLGLDTMGPSSVLAQLKSLNVTVTKIPLERSVSGLTNIINQLGQLVNKPHEAEHLITKTTQQLTRIPDLSASESRVIFLMSANSNGLMAAGKDTVPNLIFELLKVANPLAHIDGFKPVSNEVVMAINPNLILIPSHRQAGRSAAEICQLPSLALWAQKRGCNIKFVDPLSFLGVTPRLAEAALQVGKWLDVIDNDDA